MTTKSGMIAAVALAAGLDEDVAKNLNIDAAFIKQHFSSVATALISEGAVAEQQRIAGIEAAAMPGFEEIIKAHKADASKTPADAALAVIGAHNAKLAAMKTGLTADEKKLEGLKSTPVDPVKTDAKPTVDAKKRSTAARAYIAEQKKLGITVGAAEANAHIESQEG